MRETTRDLLTQKINDMMTGMDDDDIMSLFSIATAFAYSGQTHALVSGFALGMDIILAGETVQVLRGCDDFNDN